VLPRCFGQVWACDRPYIRAADLADHVEVDWIASEAEGLPRLADLDVGESANEALIAV
jgi:hypothetical protein